MILAFFLIPSQFKQRIPFLPAICIFNLSQFVTTQGKEEMVQRSDHTAWKVKAGVTKRYPTWERSPIFVQLGLHRADSSTEAAEKGGGVMGEKGKRSIKRQLRVSLFVKSITAN